MSEIIHSSLKNTVKGTVFVFLSSSTGILIWFFTKLLIARHTTKEELGLYSLAIAVVSIFSWVATFGMGEAITRYISLFLGENKKASTEGITRAATQMGFIAAMGSFVILFAFSGYAARHIFYMPKLATPLKIIAFFLPVQIMATLLVGILRGHGIIKPKIIFVDIGQPLLFFLALLACVFLKLPFQTILLAYLFAAVAMFFGVAIYGRRLIGLKPVSFKIGSHYRELVKFSLVLFSVGVWGIFLDWTDSLILGRYTGAATVGTYNISTSLARLINFPFEALSFVFLPLAVEMFAKKQIPELKRTYQVLTKWIFSATLPIFFVLFFFPDMVITFLFGSRFVDAAMPLRILSLGFLARAFLGVNGLVMITFGMQKPILKLGFLAALINVAFNYFLIKWMGMGVTGAAIAGAIPYFTINVWASYLLYRETGIHPITSRYLKPIGGVALVCAAIYEMAKSLPLQLWMLPMYLALFMAGYGVSLIATRSIEREDILMLEAVSEKTGLELGFLKRIFRRFVPEA